MGLLSRTAAAGCALLFLGTADAQNLVSLNTQGTLVAGTDYDGVFTAPGGNLAKLPFTLSMTADTSLLNQRNVSGGQIDEAPFIGAPLRFSGELTVNGRSYKWEVDSGYGGANLFESADDVSFSMSAQGYGLPAGASMFDVGVAMDSGGRVPGHTDNTRFDQVIELNGGLTNGDLTIGLGGTVQSNPQGFYMSAHPTYALWSPNPVPEPASMAMWLVGIGVLIGRRRRYRQ